MDQIPKRLSCQFSRIEPSFNSLDQLPHRLDGYEGGCGWKRRFGECADRPGSSVSLWRNKGPYHRFSVVSRSELFGVVSRTARRGKFEVCRSRIPHRATEPMSAVCGSATLLQIASRPQVDYIVVTTSGSMTATCRRMACECTPWFASIVERSPTAEVRFARS